MATFGWACIDCSDSGSAGGGGQAAGPTGSVQFVTGANATSGSLNLMFHTGAYGIYAANTLILTGTLVVEGTVSASHYHIENVTEIDSSGSTYFGDSTDDVHIRTGSMFVGAASGSGIKTAFGVDVNTNQTKILGLRGEYSQITTPGQTSSADVYLYGFQVAGDVDFRLHSAASAGTGSILVLKDEEQARTGQITIHTSGSETIDNANTYQLSGTNPAISLYSNGENWFVF